VRVVSRWSGLEVDTCIECVMSLGDILDLIMARCRLTLTLTLSINWEVMLWAYKTVVSVSFCIRVGLLKWFMSALTCLYIRVQLVIGRVSSFFCCTVLLRRVQVL